MGTDVWADPAANKGQWILGIPADRLAAVRKLVRVLEGGVLPFPPKEPLVLDSIEATMGCVTFDEGVRTDATTSGVRTSRNIRTRSGSTTLRGLTVLNEEV